MRLRPGVKAVAALAALAFGAFVPVPALAPATPAAAAVGTEDGTRTINVLGITDLHGHIETTTDPGAGAVTDPGAVTLACEVSRARQSDPNSLLVSSGDNVGASAFTSALLDDQPTLDVLNAVGTDVSAVGNHEFDGGLDDFTGRILPAADFPYLSANVTGSAPLDAEGDGGGAFVKEVDGVKIGFVGIMTDELPTLLAPATANALTLAPAAATANAKAAALKNSGAADVVVVLAHADAAELAPHLTGDVDAVLGGHTHVPYPADGGSAVVKSTDGQDIAVLQADHYGWRLAELSLSYDPATRAVSVVSADNKDLRTSDCTTDAYGVESIVSNASTRAAEVGNERAAAIGSDFLRGSSDGTTPGTNRGTESTASNLIADSFASWASGNVPRGDAEHVIGLMNAGGVRADYLYARNAAGGEADDGIVTEGESRSVQPFGNEMGYATITGAQLKAVLAQQWQPGAARSVLSLGTSSNVSVLIDQDAADELYAIQAEISAGTTTADGAANRIADARSRVIGSVVVDGTAVADDDSVLVASNSFLITGGDGYTALSQVPSISTGTLDRDATADYLNSFADRPASASYVKHQIGLGDTVSTTNPRAVTLRLTGLTYSNDSEKPGGVARVRYSYQNTAGATVTSDPVAVDTTTVADLPETGRATLEVVFGQDAATRSCTFTDSGRPRTCFLASIDLLDAAGTVVDSYDYELTTDGTTGMDAPAAAPSAGASTAPIASERGEDVIVAPTTDARPDRGRDLARTGASIGVGVLAVVLVAGGVILLIRRRRTDGGLDDDDRFDDPGD